MADVSQTPTNVTWVSGVTVDMVKAGTIIAAGQPCYLDTSDAKYKLGDADSAAASEVNALSISGGVDGRHMVVARRGARVNIGFTATAGISYYLSSNAGGITADVPTGKYNVLLFIGEGTALVNLLFDKGPVVAA